MLGGIRTGVLTGWVCVWCLLAANGAARADVTDGNLSDWGVTPFVHWTPLPGTAYIEDNYPDANFPYGGERFDIEAFYLKPTPTSLRVGIITSFPECGMADPYDQSIWIDNGDLLLDLNQSDGRLWEWAITLNGPHKGDIYYRPALILSQAYVGLPDNSPSNVDVANSAAPVGHADVAWFNYGDLEGYGSDTYGVEVSANWADLGGPVGMTSIIGRYTMGCGNDVISLATVGTPVPEPTTLSLLLIGGLVFAAPKLRRRVRVATARAK